jgi:hypothetical protein
MNPFSKIHFSDNSGYILLRTDSVYDMQCYLYDAFIENNCSDSLQYDHFQLYIHKQKQETKITPENHRD